MEGESNKGSWVPNTPTLGGSSSFNDSGKADCFLDLIDKVEKHRNTKLFPIQLDLIGRAVTPSIPNSERRKLQIANSLKALHELLPNTEVGSQAHILDDVIDYVQYLQNQVKELCGSKLQADSNATPLVFHE
ncbi:transcription factor bHLH66-like, partial [Trifolium medium]|nr:transcription factor bHLH66-like [Trifolium medium]